MLVSEAEKLRPGDKVLFHSGTTIADGRKGGFVFPAIRIMIVVDISKPPTHINICEPGKYLTSPYTQWVELARLAPYDEETLARMQIWQKLYESMLSEIWAWMQDKKLVFTTDISPYMPAATRERLRNEAANTPKPGSELFRDPFNAKARDKPIVVAKKEK